jgi:uracil-DNA glycosylase family 4
MTTTVVHKREPHDVYIGRPSVFGNPFSWLPQTPAKWRAKNREDAIAKFEKWLEAQPKLVERARRELYGKVLGCWCKPQACHGDVWARIVDGTKRSEAPTTSAVNGTLRQRADSYDARAAGAECDRCPIAGRTVVPPEKPRGKLTLIVIGEGPGGYETRVGRPFVGPSGKLLDAALREAGGARHNCHVTNAVLCFNEGDEALLDAALPCCAPRLARELAALPAATPIMTLGKPAFKTLTGKAGLISKKAPKRGFIWQTTPVKDSVVRSAERKLEKLIENKRSAVMITRARNSLAFASARHDLAGRVELPTIHPAFILRGADMWLPVFRIDVNRAVGLSTGKLQLSQLEDVGAFKRTTNPNEAHRLLRGFSKEVVVDIETDAPDPLRASITCVGICDINDTSKIVVMDRKSDSEAWDLRFVPVIAEFLKGRLVVGHNIIPFDEPVLKRYGIVLDSVFDTLVAHRSFASHLPQSLAFVASIYCLTSPWKLKFKSAEEKGAVAGFGVKAEDLAAYNAADVRLNALAYNRMRKDIEAEASVCARDHRMACLYARMSAKGLLVDEQRRKQLSLKLKHRAAALIGEMRQLLQRKSFSPRKNAHIQKAFFKQLRVPLWMAPRTKKTNQPSAAAIFLERMREDTSTRAGRLADLIIRYRSANDSRAEYLDVDVHTDGRVHPSWKQVETGRPATRRPNILNIPKMAFCEGCGVKLLDGCSHGKWKKVITTRDGVDIEEKSFVECKKKQEPQPEEQLRDIYVAAPGHKLVYFDLSQAEMRLAAFLSGDPAFMAACAGDIHTENACILFPDGADMIRADPGGKGFKFRQMAKSMGFAVSYLAEAPTILGRLKAAGFDVDIFEVETMLNHLQSSYRVYYKFVDHNVELCRRQGYLRTPFHGRIRWLGRFPRPTTVANFPIQSGVADIMNDCLLALDEKKPKKAELIVYHYDAAIYETPDEDVPAMEALIKNYWMKPVVIPSNGLSYVQKIDFKVKERLSEF